MEATMIALFFDDSLTVRQMAKPKAHTGEALIRVHSAGICNTDLEIIKGYIPGFKGIPGHEFVGEVVSSPDRATIGHRVTGEINGACNSCDMCRAGLQRHCPDRTVLGIINRDGAFAEYLTLPAENVVRIPDAIEDRQAVLIEPLAAACAILEQVAVGPDQSVLLIGDGKLAILIGWVLQATGCRLTAVGKHSHKLSLLSRAGIETVPLDRFKASRFDMVVEASGNPRGLAMALEAVRPRGTVVLKSTYADATSFDQARVVVDEITIKGSRCGRFEDAIRFIHNHKPPLERLITAEYPLRNGIEAFRHAQEHDSLKIVLNAGS
jgi:2-desacetyl-2-hydroxyethyl bacteriochlorophyllide A dehydrogenase